MKPAWVTNIGIFGIIFGAMGLFGAGQTAMTPKIIEMQKTFFNSAMAGQTGSQQQAAQMQQFLDKFLGHQPEWFGSACLILAGVGVLVNALYILGAISFLQLKPYAVKFFSAMLCVSMVAGIARAMVFAKGFSVMGLGAIFTGMASAVVDIIFLFLIITNDKSAFGLKPSAEVVSVTRQ